MSLFNFLRSNNGKSDSSDQNTDDSELNEYVYESFEFSDKYSFNVDVPLQDEFGEYTGEFEEISGQVEVSGEATWDSYAEGFVISYSTWRDLSGRFDDTIGSLPDGSIEDDFHNDFKNYISSQGIDSKYIKFNYQ